jgi:hypothetical protein
MSADTSLPPLMPLHAGLSAMPALLKSFPVPSSVHPTGLTPPLAPPSAAGWDPTSPAMVALIADAARAAPAWASKHARTSASAAPPTTPLSPMAAAMLAAIQTAMAEANANVDARFKSTDAPQGGTGMASRLRSKTAAPNGAETDASALTKAAVGATPEKLAAPKTELVADAAKRPRATTPDQHAATKSTADSVAARTRKSTRTETKALAAQPVDAAESTPKEEDAAGTPDRDAQRSRRSRPSKAAAATELLREAVADDATIAAVADSFVQAPAKLPAVTVLHLVQRLRQSVGGQERLPATVDANSLSLVAKRCFEEAKGTPAGKHDGARPGAVAALGLALLAGPHLRGGADESLMEASLDALSALLRCVTRALKDMDASEGKAAAKKGQPAAELSAAVSDLLLPTHDGLRSLMRLLLRQFNPTMVDATGASFSESQLHRVEELAVGFAFAALRCDAAASAAQAPAAKALTTYIVTPSLDLVATLAAYHPGAADRLVAETLRALPEPSAAAATARVALLSVDSGEPLHVGLPAALCLRVAMAGGCVMPWAIDRSAGGRSAIHGTHDAATLTPKEILDRSAQLARRIVDGVMHTYFTAAAVAQHGAAKGGAVAAFAAFVDDLCTALSAPEVPVADYALRHAVSAVVRGCLKGDAPIVSKAPAAVAGKLRKAAVEIVGSATLAALRATRWIDPEAALCELAWVSDAESAAFANVLEAAWTRAAAAARGDAPPTRGAKKSADEGTCEGRAALNAADALRQRRHASHRPNPGRAVPRAQRRLRTGPRPQPLLSAREAVLRRRLGARRHGRQRHRSGR